MKKASKILSLGLVMALVLSLLSGFSALATSNLDSTSTATPTPNPVITSYDVQLKDGKTTVKRGETIEKITIKVYDIPNQTIMARINTSAFMGEAVSSDVKDSDGTYTFEFKNVKFVGGSTEFSLELIYVDSNFPIQYVKQNFSQCDDFESPVATPTPTPEPTPEPTPVPEDVPKILVKDFTFGGTSIEAGKEFELALTLFTTSGNTNLQDVMVGLNFGDQKGVSLASGSMNTYVGTMGPSATRVITYKVTTDATIDPGAISINVQVTSKNGADSSSPISIPVTQPERFEITNMEAPETLYVGEDGYLSVSFVNKGKSSINNLSAEIQGTNLANPGQSQFLGNVAAGTENSVDFSVMGMEGGIINGRVILSYEDAKGEVKTLEKEFSCTVEEMPIWDDPGIYDPGMDIPADGDATGGMPWWGWLLIAVLVVGAAVAAVFVAKKKKANKEALLEEDDDEDI